MLDGRVAEVARILRFLGLEPDPGRLECVRWCDLDMYRCRCTVQEQWNMSIPGVAKQLANFGSI